MGPSTIFLVSLFSLLIPAHSAPDPTLDSHWQLWVKKHKKTYKDAEEEHARRTIWEETLKFITVHNLEYSLGLHTYDVGMNHLGDMTGEEMTPTITDHIGLGDSLANMTEVPKEVLEAQAPSSIDWRSSHCVTPVKHQGSCYCSYAFSAVGALECQWKKKTGRLLTFSPQELVDCSYTEGNSGCYWGYLCYSFAYMRKYGLMQESAYPYEGQEGKCIRKRSSNTGLVHYFYRVPAGNDHALMNAVGTIGPVSVWIDAGHQGFRMYKSGVYYDPYCTNHVNHVVLTVGYGTENGINYWLVKNSWGKNYGNGGYIKMARNYDKDCGITQFAYYPTV
ncbi:cathepsin S [Xenopus laevis]|uniref:Cathepsin S n=2 Tax=Xenopus laevis TaxID=8355 RepID=A0A1L8FBR5_XENLA|nr:cathepsin S [Xenopus laevis]XP_041429398.1 cathepsin S [Xenopus laevis]OCT69034.1 hypothetical protein XELAEV_18040342mg [Xenopus laevis]